MMQDGLHIGLAAWINQQQNTGAFAAYPALPIATELVDLEGIRNVGDLAKAAEFARLVNFVPRQGQAADIFSDSAVLWRVHREILAKMEHATEALTNAEQAMYQDARNVLFTIDDSGLPIPSPNYLLYLEMQRAYEDLISSSGNPGEIAQAMTNWIVLGNKQAIEQAIQIINRLEDRSSRSHAESEKLSLNVDPPGVGLRFFGDMGFAPTYFMPISATNRQTWMEAKVSFADLDLAVGNGPLNGKWKAYLANREGEVLFDYVVLACIRPWFTHTLYEADDWRITSDNTPVSKGNGLEGLLPAFVEAVYLVAVKNVTTRPKPPPPPRPQPRPIMIGITNVVNTTPLQPISSSKSPGDSEARLGVVKRAGNASKAIRTVSTPTNSPSPQPVRILTTTVLPANYTALNLGQVRRVTAIDLSQRYLVAQAYLTGVAQPDPIPTEGTEPTTIYVAGFGCKKVPFSPNPNVNYQWQ
jgi:hypothetical protein